MTFAPPLAEARLDTSAITVTGLTKRYGTSSAVDDVSFDVRRGRVTALLGPNGSGKTTTLRLMVGLATADAGVATFDLVTYAELPNPAAAVGLLLDASAQHAGRSVFETARLAGLLVGVGRGRVRQCLDAVGLGDVGRRRVGALSLGMRQRLGLAIALLGDPPILILDEPGNGLDPEGLAWLSGFLARFAAAGGTVLVSSHHLAEIEAIADEVVILDRGSVRYRGAVHELAAASSVATSQDDARLLAAAREHGISAESVAGGGILARCSPADLGGLSIETHVVLTSLRAAGSGLEDFFLENTNGEFQGRHAADLMDLSTASMTRGEAAQ